MIQKLINDSIVSSWGWMENELTGLTTTDHLSISFINTGCILQPTQSKVVQHTVERKKASKPLLIPLYLSDGKTIHHTLW